jgi:peroxiredoxin Q/BCP
VIGVSRDPQDVVDRFRASLDLPYPLVGDPGGTICRAYKARWPLIGKAKRITYVIGRDRRIRTAYRDELRMSAHAARACAAAGLVPK